MYLLIDIFWGQPCNWRNRFRYLVPGENIDLGDIHNAFKEIIIKITDEESRLWLLQTLSRKGLATRDIFSFAK